MKVVHFKKEPYDVYIGRPSMWGNPHPLGYQCRECNEEHTRAEAVELYETYARGNPKLLAAIRELPADAVLGCWCAPRACHGDIIIKLWKEMHALDGLPKKVILCKHDYDQDACPDCTASAYRESAVGGQPDAHQ